MSLGEFLEALDYVTVTKNQRRNRKQKQIELFILEMSCILPTCSSNWNLNFVASHRTYTYTLGSLETYSFYPTTSHLTHIASLSDSVLSFSLSSLVIFDLSATFDNAYCFTFSILCPFLPSMTSYKSIFVLCCCITNYPKTEWLKTIHFLSHSFFFRVR